MKYSHERLEKLINGVLRTPEMKNESFFIPDFETFREEFMREVKNMETYLNRKAVPMKNEKIFKTLVHQYQTIIIIWLDRVSIFKATENTLYPVYIYELILDELQKLLSVISKRFETYFNYEEKLPEIFLQASQQKIKSRFNRLVKHLIKESISSEVLSLILFPIKDFLAKAPTKKVTFRTLFYIQKYEEQLLNFSSKKYTGNGCEEKAIIEFVVYQNLNSSRITDYLINKILRNIETESGHEKKLEKLVYFLKEFNQFKVKSNTAYKPHAATLKEQVTKWINEEIYYHEKRAALFYMPAIGKEENIAAQEKIHLSLSVEVLALIVRAAKDMNVILNQHNTEIFRNISKIFRSVHAEKMSVNSLVKKSYVGERSTKETAIDTLHEMIKKIHGY